MTPRARRLLAAAALLIVALFVGRWVVGFLADRWWAAAISPEALDTVTHWHLLGLALDAAAVLVASAWFAAQALLVARAIGSVQVERRIGQLRVREAIPVRMLLLGAIGTGVLLGILTGVGAGAWRAPVALAGQDLRYGINDPLLGSDLGVLLGEYPVWRLAHHFAALLAILGLAFATVLYLGIGALRRSEGRVELHPDARRHLGGLLAVLAAVIAVGYLLAPYRLATSLDVPLGIAAAATRVVATQAAAGAAIGVAIISIGWALRSRHTMLTAAWAVLALAALTERWVIPAFVAQGTATTDRRESTRALEALLYGIRLEADSGAADSLPAVMAVWDADALSDWSAGRGGMLIGAEQAGVGAGGTWLTATEFPGNPATLEVTAIAAGALTPAGTPVVLPDDSSHRPLLRDPRAIPGTNGWRAVQGRAVTVGGALRRTALAWALQAPGVLALSSETAIDWDLDPQARTRRLLPALTWRTVGLAEHQGRLAWVVSGMATVPRAPLTTRTVFGGRDVAGVVPALVATVHADDGSVEFFLDPAADSLGHAWARVAGSLVRPADALPGWLRAALPYAADWFAVQVGVLEQSQWGLGRRPAEAADSGTLVAPASTWGEAGPALQVMLEDPARPAPVTLLEASRAAGQPRIVATALATFDVPSDAERQRTWRRLIGFAQARDSVRAAGDTLVAGPLRHHPGSAGMVSWQAFRSAGRRGAPAVVWIAAARGRAVGGGRDPAAALASLAAATGPEPDQPPLDAARRLEALRGWISRADSALARGDLTAFARAWEAVRGLMSESPRE